MTTEPTTPADEHKALVHWMSDRYPVEAAEGAS
jgi:hypothetical protein